MAFEKLKNMFKKKNKGFDIKNLLKKNSANKSSASNDSAGDDSLDIDNLENLFGDSDDENMSMEAENFYEENSVQESQELDLPEEESEERDINDELNDLLREDAETEVVDVNYDYINDVSVYDTVRNDKDEMAQDAEEGESDENAEGAEGVKTAEAGHIPILMIVIGALLLLVLISAIALFVLVNKNGGFSPNKTSNSNVKKTNMVDQSEFTSNSANYIFLNQTENLGDEKIQLSKMLADPVATVFYFKNNLNTQKYSFVLTDDSDKLYSMDLYFVENNGNSDEESNNSSGETVIRFEPLNPSAKSITLSVRENFPQDGSDELRSAEFKIGFNQKLQMSEVKYLKKPVTVENDEFSAEIINTVLASSGTCVEYFIKSKDDKDYKITQGLKSNSKYVEFEEGSVNLVGKKKVPEIYSFDNDNELIGRMDFGNVRNLNGRYFVTLTDIYKKYDTNSSVTSSSISAGKEEKTHTFDVGNYRIVFEGLGAFNDRYLLVFHAEDKNVPSDPKNPLANRVEAIIDAQLVGTTSTGMEVVLDGKCTAAQRGTDMTFPVDETVKSFIYGVNRDNLKIDIKSILIKMDDIKIPIDYNQFSLNQNVERKTLNDSIVTAFESRLKYKSNRGSFQAITGFDNSVLEDSSLMGNYEQLETNERPNYCAKVISQRINGDSAVAVVQDTWVGVTNGTEIQFYRRHKIRAQKSNLGWTITEDKIIQ